MSKPTASGEWTGLSLSRLIKEKGYKGAADAHNAALAAEWEKVQTLVDALKRIAAAPLYRDGYQAGEIADAALAKVVDSPVQLPMINDDPIIELK